MVPHQGHVKPRGNSKLALVSYDETSLFVLVIQEAEAEVAMKAAVEITWKASKVGPEGFCNRLDLLV